jgi:hypothetical protein
VGEILGLEASSILDDLLSQGLIYCDPSRELNFWRPKQSALLTLGFRSYTDIPALKELEEWFDTQKEIRAVAKLDPFFEENEQARFPAAQTRNRAPRNAGGVCADAAALSLRVESPQSVVQGCSAQGGAVGSGEKES